MPRCLALVVLCCVLALTQSPVAAVPRAQETDGVDLLLLRLQQLMLAGNPDPYLDLLSTYADRPLAREAAQLLIAPSITRAVIRERDRIPLEGALPGDGFRLMAEVFTESGDRARVATWRIDVRRVAEGTGADAWGIAGQEQISAIDGLFRLSLNAVRQYRVSNLTFTSEDLEIKLASGRLFVSETPDGPTAVILLPGSGATFGFRPTPDTEREQVRLFSGADTLESEYDEVFLRLNPGQFAEKFPASSIQLEAVDEGAMRRAQAVFREYVDKSFSLDMGDMSRESWSLAPGYGDLIVEVKTRRFQTITYAKSGNDPEDVTVFERRRRRNISVYASRASVAQNGRFFNEDALAPYDITDYHIEASFEPDRQMIDGRTRLRLTAREAAGSLTFKLADALTVKSVYSTELGRLLFLRVRNQNSLVVTLPSAVTKDRRLTFVIEYSGRLEPAEIEREALSVGQQDPFMRDIIGLPGELSLLYTTRSYWYPQSGVSDYAPALLRLTVPKPYGVLASGELSPESPVDVAPLPGQKVGSRQFTFAAPQPIRYLSCLITKLARVDARTIPLTDVLSFKAEDGSRQRTRPMRTGVFYDDITLTVDTNPRLQTRGRRLAPIAEDIVKFYTGLVGDSPYPSLALGLIERDLPGGHSPAYMNVIHQPSPQATFSWSNDPSAFPNYPEFFVAHEIAHQWWGQAIGWRSYHEQWISEGFAQYFAAMYAQKSRGDQAFADVLERMSRFARSQSSQGPISLGYRLGHIRGDMRVFRSLVYNKSAVVLHKLRVLLGDEVFLRGMRRFYFDWRFKKASTDDVRRAFEMESGQDLKGFFENWFHTSGVPVVKFSWSRESGGTGPAALVHFEQVGTVFDMPVTLTLRYADNTTEDVVVPVRARTADARLPLRGTLRDIGVNVGGAGILDVYKQ